MIDPQQWPPLERMLRNGVRDDDPQRARDQTLFALLMGMREPAIAEVYVGGDKVDADAV